VNLFVVETPLQLLNAHEARQHLGASDAHLLLFVSPAYSYETFSRLIEGRWTSIQSFVIRDREDEQDGQISDRDLPRKRFIRKLARQLTRRQRLERALRSYGPAERVFLGNYLIDYMRHVGHTVQHRELIVLDDGTDTIRMNNLRHRVSTPGPLNGAGPFAALKSSVRARYLEWDSRQARSLVFFSTYDLRVRPGDRLIQHRYRYLRERICTQSAEDAVFFLGQPLPADGYLGEETYLEALREVRRHFAGQRIVYVPHPRESEATVARVADATHLAIKRFDAPIEIVIACRGIRPRALASFFCSALETCSVLCGDDLPVKAFRLARRSLLCCHDDVGGIYDHFRDGTNGQVEVVDLA
jgi:hypothetical protein